MTQHMTPDWDPKDQSVLEDQRRAYDEMRERCPVAYSEFLGWSLFRHADIEGVLADPETFSSATPRRAIPNGMDPPEHTRYRRALEPFFSAEWLAPIEQRSREIAGEHVQALLGRPDIDFVAEFAQPFSLKTLCAFLGWPAETWERARGWTHGNQQAAFSRDRQAGAALARAFSDYVKGTLQDRRDGKVSGSDDVTTALMGIEIDGGPLSDDGIVSILRTWTAGHGTVAAALGILALHLAENQQMQQQLRDQPELLPAAIDEILRVDGPLVSNRRTTTREVTIGDRRIGAGENLSLIWIAANRDGEVFDNPDAVRIDRDPSKNLVFGAGIHYCLGAPLARLEMRVGLEELLSRTKSIELASDAVPARVTYPSNGLVELMLRLS